MIGSIITRKTISKGNPTSALVLQSPNLTKWIIRPSALGVLQVFSGAAGAINDIKIDVSGTEYSLHISNNGELQTKSAGDLSGTATLVSNFRMRGIDGQIHALDISVSGEIQLTAI